MCASMVTPPSSPPRSVEHASGGAPTELLEPFERLSFKLMDTLHRRALPLTEAWLRGSSFDKIG